MARSEGSYIRWQTIALEQLGYAIGLILSFAAASLGFALSIVKDAGYVPSCWSKAFMLAAGVSLMLSIGLGLWCVVNRLRDFRKTRSIARDREDWERALLQSEDISKRLETRRNEVRKIGNTTWCLFYWQTGTFAFGVVALIVAFGITYHSRIF